MYASKDRKAKLEEKKTGGTETRNKQINNYRDFNTTFSVIELTDNPKIYRKTRQPQQSTRSY